MAEFNSRADAVDVMQVLARIRENIRERRGPDDTETEVRRQADATLERCLEPRRSRSELVEHNRRLTPPGRFDRDAQGRSLAPEPFEFDEDTLYASSRGTMGKLIRLIRKILNPILRLFFNPDPIVFAMMRQAEINSRLLDLLNRVNAEFERTGKKFAAREELDALNYEVTHNLVVEMTRLAVDMKNHKMLVESVAGRLDFDERRAQAIETVAQTRSTPPAGDAEGAEREGGAAGATRSRRRRRRSRRRSGSAAPGADAAAQSKTPPAGGAPTGADSSRPPSESAAQPGAPSESAAAAPSAVHAPPASRSADGVAESESAAAPSTGGDPGPPPPAAPTPAAPPDDAGER